MALATRALGAEPAPLASSLLGIIGAALFYGDAVITPALSVLSAIEGMDVATPAFDAYVGADHRGDPDRAVCLPVAGHRAGRGAVRADHVGLVRGDCASRVSLASRRDPGVLAALDPAYGFAFLPTTE